MRALRVLPKGDGHGVRPGQAWLDARGRVLWVQNVIEELREGRALAFVLNAKGRMDRGAFVRFSKLGRLVLEAPDAWRKCSQCDGPAKLVAADGSMVFCGNECWAKTQAGAKATHG